MQLRRGPLVVRGASSWRVIGRGALAGRGSPIRRRATRVGVTEGGGRSGGRHRKRGVAGDCTFGGRECGVVAGNDTEFRTPAPHPTARRGIHAPNHPTPSSVTPTRVAR